MLAETLAVLRKTVESGAGADRESAVWAAMGSLVLNLDQTITKD